MPPRRVAICGSGNWGSAIARIIGSNVKNLGPERFIEEIQMYCYEEVLSDGKKLTEVINTTHENVKYLPGFKLPDNIVANPDLRSTVKDADLLIWVVPHNYLSRMFKDVILGLSDDGEKNPRIVNSISLIKGCNFDSNTSRLELISDSIRMGLVSSHTYVSGISHANHVEVLMGANVANEVAEGQFCEATIGYDGHGDNISAKKAALEWMDLFSTSRFVTSICPDRPAVEMCGALKNVVALAAGFCDGLGCGGNTKAAIMRIGLVEMLRFCRTFAPTTLPETLLESCGVADLITTCYGGRNRKCAAEFVTRSLKNQDDISKEPLDLWKTIETELLNGQKLQGTGTSTEVHLVLSNMNLVQSFPLFDAVYRVQMGQLSANSFVDALGSVLGNIKGL
jgi:glycerol-3-phosphate dehydrogenase (NAD+)